MSEQKIRLYFDEDMPVAAANQLERRGILRYLRTSRKIIWRERHTPMTENRTVRAAQRALERCGKEHMR